MTERGSVLTGFVVALLLALPFAALSQGTQAGTARMAVGGLLIVHSDGVEDRLQGKGAVQLFDQDVLTTEGGGRAVLDLAGGGVVALNENTSMRLTSRWEKAKGVTRVIRLDRGEIWLRSPAGQNPIEVETPLGVAVTEQGELVARQHEGETAITAVQGEVEFVNIYGACRLRPATVTYSSRGKACTTPAQTDVRSASAWSGPLLQP